MADTLVSLKDFLQERHFVRKGNESWSPLERQRIEQSQLLKAMQDICAAINAEARMVLVDEHHYLPPEPVVSSFTFTRGHTEYLMRLEHWGPKPSLVFATRKWRDASRNRLFRWFRQLARLEPLTVSIRFVCELEGDDVSAEEIRRCFFYLLSGLSRSYIPSFKTRDGG